TVPAPADGTTVTFNADGLSAPVAVENCAALPKLAASGQCDADNGQVVFTLVNEGGPMTAGATYTITGSAGELASGTSDVLDAGQSQTFTVPAPADGTTVTFNADGLSAPVAVENCAAPVKASLTILKVVNGQISGPYDFEICVKGPSLDQCVMLRNGASITFEDLEPGVYTVSEPNIGPEWSVIGTGDVELVEGVPASVNVINTPTLCEMSMVNANGELIVAANPALCAPVEVAQVPEPITIELAGTGPVCPDWFVYHTLQTGDVEVFRLGELPDNPDADDNLSKGENADPRLAYDQEPSRSPDSAWVVFASNRTGSWELWRGTTDGERQEQLTFQSGSIEWDPAWSPLGTYIVYDSSRDGNWNLYLLNVETGEERQLTDNDGADINGFWHPDGDKVLFLSLIHISEPTRQR
ncbi:MAG: hypothetical protein QUV05_13370, partial [Phycisphaerae bacterium]|nr:hypothetical protein [Phycisphaerae bacterium]